MRLPKNSEIGTEATVSDDILDGKYGEIVFIHQGSQTRFSAKSKQDCHVGDKVKIISMLSNTSGATGIDITSLFSGLLVGKVATADDDKPAKTIDVTGLSNKDSDTKSE